MISPGKKTRRSALTACLCVMALATSGCHMTYGFAKVIYEYGLFWETTPLIPVSAYQSQKIEDAYHEAERYGKVYVLDPVEGEHAPLFCLDPPTPDEVMRALPDNTKGGAAFLWETQRNNVRIVTDLIVDRIDDCRFFPMVGPARQHHCHYKCTVYYDETIRSYWPIPFEHTDKVQEVVYIDHNRLIRCAGPTIQQ